MTYRPLNLSRLAIHQCLLSGSRPGNRKIDSHSIFISSGESAPTELPLWLLFDQLTIDLTTLR
jgi:hypothetical protein